MEDRPMNCDDDGCDIEQPRSICDDCKFGATYDDGVWRCYLLRPPGDKLGRYTEEKLPPGDDSAPKRRCQSWKKW